MVYGILADLVLALHFSFILFVVLGGLLAFRWRSIVWFHIPAVVWAVVLEFCGWICPLTPLENWYRSQAGTGTYEGDFILYYLMPVIYPSGLTRELQLVLGMLVFVLNAVLYYWLYKRYSVARTQPSTK